MWRMSCSDRRMRRLFLTLLLTGAALSGLLGRTLPLTIKEVTLMLRSGFSSENVQRELSVRRFAESCDAAGEKALRDAGAAPALIDAIKNGSYASSPADAQAAQNELAAQATRRARENEQSRKFNTLYQDQLARARAAAPAQVETPTSAHRSTQGRSRFVENRKSYPVRRRTTREEETDRSLFFRLLVWALPQIHPAVGGILQPGRLAAPGIRNRLRQPRSLSLWDGNLYA